MNKLFIIGNLTKGPEIAYTKDQIAVCNFSVAVNEVHGGNKTVEYFNCTAWRKLAENIHKYLKKGSKVSCVGAIHTQKYTDKNGVERYATRVDVSEVEFLTSAKGNEAAGGTATDAVPAGMTVANDEDLPF